MSEETGGSRRLLKLLLGLGGLGVAVLWLVLHATEAGLEIQIRTLGGGLILVTILVFLCCSLPQRGAPPFRKRKFVNNLPFDIPLVGLEPQTGTGQPVPPQQDPSAPVPQGGTVQDPPNTYYATNVGRLHFVVDLGARGEDTFDVSCPETDRIAEADMTVVPAPVGAPYQRRYTVVVRHTRDTAIPLTSMTRTFDKP